MSEKRLSFGRAWLCVCWLVPVGASAGVCLETTLIIHKPETYISPAKLVAGGPVVGQSTTSPTYQEHLQDFYGTVIETLESSEMHRRVQDRVRALHPELKECEVRIQASQNKGSAIFNVRAFGSEPKLESRTGNPSADLAPRLNQVGAELEELELMVGELTSKIAMREEIGKQ